MPRDTRVFKLTWSNGDTKVCNRMALSGYLSQQRYVTRKIVLIEAAPEPDFADVTEEFSRQLRAKRG
jgi:hypothetical protein